ncbi:hypothetical protein SARC_01810 [Sphaeroforma arctica JP610]|uniref:Complex I assembly factor TIMMDC1, mitochondrial n=1 Tax=Sphaeroforma arctica JP610 TaxID=667725 RepID=A0A0L0GAR5_9EUKA|nr:hypothetical protein SARC_01810 [Sphaeroforma arctica JP610]KNC86009.1 hypothetical protein SARC_01810 [Sphaeroforma arctica JP610]|eukprot:XP_014159911.1 hypothetical protein SARC_01810 [Sphaeroforma arctica JP610]
MDFSNITNTEWYGRLKEVFKDLSVDREQYPETELTPEFRDWVTMTSAGTLCAGVAAGMNAARLEGERHIKENKNTVYKGVRHAQSELNMAAGRAFAQIGGRWTLYGFVLMGCFNALHIGASVVRQKKDALNVMGAGTVTGALFWIPYGLQGMATGAMHGSVLGLVGGVAMQAGWMLEDKVDPPADRAARKLVHDAEIEQIREERRLHNLRMQQATANLIDDLSSQIE